jgi:hypothetical protein
MMTMEMEASPSSVPVSLLNGIHDHEWSIVPSTTTNVQQQHTFDDSNGNVVPQTVSSLNAQLELRQVHYRTTDQYHCYSATHTKTELLAVLVTYR